MLFGFSLMLVSTFLGLNVAAAPPVQSAHRPATPQSPAVPAPSPPPAAAAVPSRSSGPTNKYGITVPNMNDLKDPRFQSAFKFAGNSVAAAGGLLNKHFPVGGQNNAAASASPEPAHATAPPPKNPKPVPFSRVRSQLYCIPRCVALDCKL